jgi:hypothetical protein
LNTRSIEALAVIQQENHPVDACGSETLNQVGHGISGRRNSLFFGEKVEAY